MSDSQHRSVEDLEAGIRELRSAPPERAVIDLTTLANRAIIDLHNVARSEAAKRKGEADWGQWARLANAARGAVLQVAAVRDALKGIKLDPPSSSRDL